MRSAFLVFDLVGGNSNRILIEKGVRIDRLLIKSGKRSKTSWGDRFGKPREAYLHVTLPDMLFPKIIASDA